MAITPIELREFEMHLFSLLRSPLAVLLLISATGTVGASTRVILDFPDKASSPQVSIRFDENPSKGGEAMHTRIVPMSSEGAIDEVWQRNGVKSSAARRSKQAVIAHHGQASVGLLLTDDGDVEYGVALIDGVLHRLVPDAKHPMSFDAVGLAVLYPEIPKVSTSCGVEDVPVTEALPPLSGLESRWKSSSAEKIVGSPVTATVAVDLDEELMASRFANNETNAQQWLDQLFVSMNLQYERDLQVTLVRGNTTLRNTGLVNSDPYSATSPPDMLFELGNEWRLNKDDVERAFASLFSGKNSNQNSGSGIAWINQYCEKGFLANVGGQQRTVGSFNATLVIRNPAFGAEVNAPLIAHELGHNMGAAHTHCTNRNADPNNFDPVDRCFSGENPQGGQCWVGALSCPVEFAGKGTLMSYCDRDAVGCTNIYAMHPVHIDILNARIAAETPSCLSPAQAASANLSLQLSANQSVATPGQNLTYTITVANGGPNEATSLQLTTTLPSGVTLNSASGTGWTCSPGTANCSRATLASAGSAPVTVSINVPLAYAGAAQLTLQSSISSNVPDPQTGNNSATLQTPVDFVGPFRIFGGPLAGGFEPL